MDVRNLLLLALACWPACLPAAEEWPLIPPEPVLDEQAWRQLRNGEVLVENDLLDESGGAARVFALFHSPRESAWDLLGSCEANYRFVDGLRDCEILESDKQHALTRQVVKKHFLAPRMEYVFETYRQPGQWAAIRLVRGDLKLMIGSWRFDDLEDEDLVLVSHRIQVQPGFPVPRWLVRRTLRRDIGDMVACLRHLADASGNESTAQSDQERCPRAQHAEKSAGTHAPSPSD